MKKLYMKQKVFSWKDRFTVKDEWGDDRYVVEGKALSLGHKLYIYDVNGEEVAFVRQKVLSLLGRYFVYIGGEQAAEIQRRFTLARPRFEILGPGWDCRGDFFAHDYEITSAAGTVASIHKAWLSWGDSYEIAIADGVDERIALAVVLAIDCVLADASSITASSSTD